MKLVRILVLIGAQAGVAVARGSVVVTAPPRPPRPQPWTVLLYDSTVLTVALMIVVLLATYLALAVLQLAIEGRIPTRAGPIEFDHAERVYRHGEQLHELLVEILHHLELIDEHRGADQVRIRTLNAHVARLAASRGVSNPLAIRPTPAPMSDPDHVARTP